VYDDHSRIPTVRFGTPAEDAQRRDFTLNALFYNLNTREIEDFTGRGITDLLTERWASHGREPMLFERLVSVLCLLLRYIAETCGLRMSCTVLMQQFAVSLRRVIRTPLDPMATFMDDPLRLLRAVRFSSR
jgi:hypothetical protein